MRNSKIRIGQRAPLVKKLLLIEGVSRGGKFLMGNILNGFKDIEPVQYSGIVEHIPFLAKLGLIEKEVAKEILHHEVDVRCYETLIGRTLNHRVFDKSSIFNVAHHEQLLRRTHEKDTDKLLAEFYRKGAHSMFIAHETLPAISVLFETFPDMKVISLRRSPVELVYEWFTRYDMDSWGSNPKFFSMLLKGNKGPIPMYLYNDAKKFESLKGADRVIFAMEQVFRQYRSAEQALTAAEKKRILFIRFEDMLLKPHEVVRKLSKFIGKKPVIEMRDIFKREHIPSATYSRVFGEKQLEELKKHASPLYFKKLTELEKSYWSSK